MKRKINKNYIKPEKRKREMSSSEMSSKERVLSLCLSSKLLSGLEKMIKSNVEEMCSEMVRECASKYNFDAEEALEKLCLNIRSMEVNLSEGKQAKGKSNPLKKSVEKVVVAKSAFPLPYNGEHNEENCEALRQNHGLYTQCEYAKVAGKSYCKSCQKLSDKSEDGIPEYGTISQRLAVNVMDYVDPKGRKPTHYLKVMKKLKITQEMAVEEGEKQKKKLYAVHFEMPVEVKKGRPASDKVKIVKEKGAKGRPKKEKKVLEIEGEEEDLFASLVASASEEVPEEAIVEMEEETESKKKAKEEARLAKEAKLAAEKQAKEEAKAAEKQAKEAKLAEEKAAKEAKLAAEKQAKEEAKAAKEAKLAAEKQAKEEAKAAEKAAKEEKKKAEEAVKESKKSSKKVVTVSEESKEEEKAADVVKKIEIDGKKYLKSKNTGIIYDYNEYMKNGDQVVVGKWNEKTNKIDFNKAEEEEEESDEEEEAEEYDE